MPRLHIFAMLALSLAACVTSPAAGIVVRDGAQVRLLPGQGARLDDGSTLHYVGLLGDSRCRPDVRCVWVGDAELALEWHVAGAAPQPLRIHSNPAIGPDLARLGPRTVTLSALRFDSPEATFRIRRQP